MLLHWIFLDIGDSERILGSYKRGNWGSSEHRCDMVNIGAQNGFLEKFSLQD